MTKQMVHELFRGFIVTVRKDRVIICLGYVDAPSNLLGYTKESEKNAMDICEANGILASREIKREYGYNLVRLTFNI